jgi:Rrf2 family nitric oxide-sensitive transcriptional repressor
MRFALQTDYALRTLMYLASDSNRTTIAEVAGFFRIPAPNVAKVVNQLARFGYVRSVRGIGGGIELAIASDQISIGEIVERFEGSLHLLECVGTDNVCVIQDYCKLRNVLARAEQVQVDYLKSVRLCDVLPVKIPRAKRSVSRHTSRREKERGSK